MTKFKISGKERRVFKKKMHEAKSFVKNFWHFHTIDVDMATMFGDDSSYPMSDEEAKILYESKLKEISEMELKLSELS